MSPGFVLGRENVPCVAEVVNRSLKADCTDFKYQTFQTLFYSGFESVAPLHSHLRLIWGRDLFKVIRL